MVARLIRATRLVDTAYRLFDRTRSCLVLTLTCAETLARYTELAYGSTSAYRTDHPGFRRYLFPWEAAAVTRFFPPPPARVLVGGAGGGREALALAERGFEVVAFEPSRALVSRLASARDPGGLVVYRAAYEDLPWLALPTSAPPVSLDELARFDAAIFGWSSFSHLATAEARVDALRAFAQAARGPVLLSFFAAVPQDRWLRRMTRIFRWLPRARVLEDGDAFGIGVGFYHGFTEDEIRTLAARAGYEVLHLDVGARGDNWPHAVLESRTAGSRTA